MWFCEYRFGCKIGYWIHTFVVTRRKSRLIADYLTVTNVLYLCNFDEICIFSLNLRVWLQKSWSSKKNYIRLPLASWWFIQNCAFVYYLITTVNEPIAHKKLVECFWLRKDGWIQAFYLPKFPWRYLNIFNNNVMWSVCVHGVGKYRSIWLKYNTQNVIFVVWNHLICVWRRWFFSQTSNTIQKYKKKISNSKNWKWFYVSNFYFYARCCYFIHRFYHLLPGYECNIFRWQYNFLIVYNAVVVAN